LFALCLLPTREERQDENFINIIFEDTTMKHESPNFQIIKFNIIGGGIFDYKTLWAQTIFETRHSVIDHTTGKENPEPEPAAAQ